MISKPDHGIFYLSMFQRVRALCFGDDSKICRRVPQARVERIPQPTYLAK